MSSKSFWRRSVLQECLTRVSSKKCQARASSKIVKSSISNSVLQECQVGVGCQVRVSYKSVLQECLTRMSSKSVK